MNPKKVLLIVAACAVAVGIAVVVDASQVSTSHEKSKPAAAAPVVQPAVASTGPAASKPAPLDVTQNFPHAEGDKITVNPDGSRVIEGRKLIARYADGRVVEMPVKIHATPKVMPADKVKQRQMKMHPKTAEPANQDVPAPPASAPADK